MRRASPNWIAAGCGVAYLLCFLFLPFYRLIFVVRIKGYLLMSIAPAMALMLLPGILMSLSGLFLDKRIGLGVSGASFLITLIVLACGESVLPINEALRLAGNSTDSVLTTLTSLSVSMGYGGVICLLLCVADFVVELLMDGGGAVKHYGSVERPTDDFFS